jgi:ADP-dependent phosphofructokinase/glucokinase
MEQKSLDVRFKEFRETIAKMARESVREADEHLRENEASLEFPFHEGETGSLDLTLDYLDEVARKTSPVSANEIEEAYVSLVLSYKRMKGNVSALDKIIRAMQATFDLPTEEEIDRIPEGLEVPGR